MSCHPVSQQLVILTRRAHLVHSKSAQDVCVYATVLLAYFHIRHEIVLFLQRHNKLCVPFAAGTYTSGGGAPAPAPSGDDGYATPGMPSGENQFATSGSES